MHIKNNLEMNKFNFHIDPYFYIKTCTAKEEKQIQLRSAPLIITKESETGKQCEKKKQRVVLSSHIMAVIKSNTASICFLTLVIMCSTSPSCHGIYIYIEITTYTSNCYILLIIFLLIVHFSFVLSQTNYTNIGQVFLKKYQHAQVQINTVLKHIP